MHIDNTELPRNQQFYFEDGNIFLVARGIASKVHKGVLCDQSTVFDDMVYEISGKPNRLGIYDGENVIRLAETPENVDLLLEVIYRINFVSIDNVPDNLETLPASPYN
ncbi:hypothetical protein M422DRAFT_50362 [Sphaerobolus stellatus SS14]|uniref:BTB domain-containing protein n=1 Tax=Sphaerobolus stellatus (strain SS14) TaxID=990650 RepID=A0A0C9VJ05_SPHS4|nr:hypothetical protein M422DRAFT_50362 [Sphaerobolus stellatus SS14]